ncbi:MAG: hypothetical protein QNJ44_17255 [Rhodobacter sp.]|nr:hypothetical protein [Rhodobacter sp.]
MSDTKGSLWLGADIDRNLRSRAIADPRGGDSDLCTARFIHAKPERPQCDTLRQKIASPPGRVGDGAAAYGLDSAPEDWLRTPAPGQEPPKEVPSNLVLLNAR